MKNLGDIDSDDEDPLILLKLDNSDLEFELLKNLTPQTYMNIFYHIQLNGIKDSSPNHEQNYHSDGE